MKKWLPIVVTGLMAAWFLSTLRPPRDKTFAFSQFGKLPVVFNGRVQPIDSLARNSLLQIREKEEANLEPWKGMSARLIPATEWLATLMMEPSAADQWPVFRVDNQELISLLKLPGKDLAQHHDGKHYSWNEIVPGLKALDAETTRIGNEKTDASQRNAYERAAMKMRDKLWLYVQLKDTVQPSGQDLKTEVATLQSVYPAGTEALPAFSSVIDDYLKVLARNDDGPNAASDPEVVATQAAVEKFLATVKTTQAGKAYTKDELATVFQEIERLNPMINMNPPLVIPPQNAGAPGDTWKGIGTTLMNDLRQARVNPFVNQYAAMASAFKAGDVAQFNQAVTDYRAALAPNFSRPLSKARWEVFFNQMQPFYAAMVIYVLAGVLALVYWIYMSETLRRTAVWLVGLALVIHTTGLLFRMALEGRPPVTNLYSSAIFIGWGACILGLVLEGFWKNSIGIAVSSCVGFITLIIAHHLALAGDTMEMMRAVLDNNMWLATHVVIVTLGYASTFVAGFLGIIYIVMGFFTPNLTRTMSKTTGQKGELNKSLVKMIYGIVCFATLFSFVGTVLGGIWADQSWGRFWGWDPKENGALIIVLWNALILHLRWGGMVRERGLATCAVIGNIVTSWSWFGVNMLGIGLHSYGFMQAAFWWLIGFVLSQLCLVGIGCLPLHMWKSFRNTAVPVAPKRDDPGAGSPEPAVG
ncbi:MAG TPA: cytochrome c biogenesis protein CcsA [Candidatus Angelobacter sp.]|nr:cytochrome c biogenesis protein CcsA [Candidatus Angelobacter sp.]